MATSKETFHISDCVYYLKQSKPWRDSCWTKCQWRLEKHGLLTWDSYKPKGHVQIHDCYQKIKIEGQDPMTFFNGVPHGVEMAPYVLTVPMTQSAFAKCGGVKERRFVMSNLDDLKKWVREFSKVLRAEDLLDEMMRRARKELLISNQTVEEGKILLETWRKFTEALEELDRREYRHEDSVLIDQYIQNRYLVWAMIPDHASTMSVM